MQLWTAQSPSLSDTIKKGRVSGDAQVSEALFSRAIGRTRREAIKLKSGKGTERVELVEVDV